MNKEKTVLLLIPVSFLMLLLICCGQPADTEKEKDEGREADASVEVVIVMSEKEAKNKQLNTAASLNIPVEMTNTIGMKLRLIPAGSFMMGSDSDDAGEHEKPAHFVEITQPFYIGVYEVTQAEYKAVMGWNPSDFDGDRLPVESVSWDDAKRFCGRLSLTEGVKYCLPTEAEWEYACRAGTATEFFWGDSFDEHYAWCGLNSEIKTHEVGNKLPNAWDLYDMSGNVSEWCEDWYDSDYYSQSPQKNPVGPASGQYRVLRGGSFFFPGSLSNSTFRLRGDPSESGAVIGFRVVREVEE